ncbi:Cas10/Cmr2 second palm domain-containing protein [Gandjariella thermophila]|uniref:GGDEF domain-containing protein n=1 Tax=Gandjariella thermophila TaxID=1931992 RepID=A0A4D4J124_9PSEU|nr:type III-B CRISPR-associated protein Cas10/Cmr2 [Gandjariella thermophila]GDY29084.1 hypothetical protein GTS_07170 [Gandjariella thermophila]
MPIDLVFVSVGGVQRFVAESRKTVDAAGASSVVRYVMTQAAHAVQSALADRPWPCGLVFPTPGTLARAAGGTADVTNKLAFLAPAGTGPDLARQAAEAARSAWRGLVERAFGADRPTPGFPDLAWVSVTGSFGDDAEYRALWRRAGAAMGERRRARVFDPVSPGPTALCTQSPALPAAAGVPRRTARRDRTEKLSVAGWTKRHHGRADDDADFPSTTVVASAAFRAALLTRAAADEEFRARLSRPVGELDEILRQIGDGRRHRGLPPGIPIPDGLRALSDRLGTAVSPDAWEPDALRAEHGDDLDGGLIDRGHQQARQLVSAVDDARLTPYYAIVVQDLDRLGTAISGLGLADQRRAAEALAELGHAQRALADSADHLGVSVYAGGDDFVAFAPAARALRLAKELRLLTRDAIAGSPLAAAGPGGGTVTASTAVLFSHMTRSLQEAIAAAQDALHRAKKAEGRGGRNRNALTVVVRRRGGERARTILPWWPPEDGKGRTAADLLDVVAPRGQAATFSARLAARLEQDRMHLDELGRTPELWSLLRAELDRLVARQGGTAEVADALCALGLDERGTHGFNPVPAALVGRFLARECR